MTPTAITTRPEAGGRPSLPKRNGAKTMVPTTWLGRSIRFSYVDAWGAGQEAGGVLQDFYPFGLAVNVGGARTLFSWDRLILIELRGD